MFLLVLRIPPLLARGVPQQIVQFLSTLHVFHEVFLRSVGLQVIEEQINSLHCDSQSGDWVYYTVITVFLKSSNIDVGCFAELCHVSQQEDVLFVLLQSLGNYLELLSCVETFRENHVSTCINVSFRSLDALLETIYTLGIGSGADDELAI